jgi:hypothetical protein
VNPICCPNPLPGEGAFRVVNKKQRKAHQCSMEKKLFKVDFTEVTDDQLDLMCECTGLPRDFFEIHRNTGIRALYMDYFGATYAYEIEEGLGVNLTGVLSQAEEFTLPEEESLLFCASEEEIDRILAKVHMWGVDTLTPIQRKKLDRFSQQKPLTSSDERDKILPEFFRVDLWNTIQPDLKRLAQLLDGGEFVYNALVELKLMGISDVWMDRYCNLWAAKMRGVPCKWQLEYIEKFNPALARTLNSECVTEIPTQQEIDAILDKICLTGFQSLSHRELRRLRLFARE